MKLTLQINVSFTRAQGPMTDQDSSSESGNTWTDLCSGRKVYKNYQFMNSEDDSKHWINLPIIGRPQKISSLVYDSPLYKFSLIGIGKKLYVAGGTVKNFAGYERSSNKFYRYEPALDEWTQLPSMTTDRHSAAMVYLKGYIYVIGGIRDWGDEKIEVNNMERYDIIKEKWEGLRLLPVEEDEDDADDEEEEEDEHEDDDYNWTFKKVSAIVSNGRIIAYGMISRAQNDEFERDEDEDDKSDIDEQKALLIVYHPDKNEWKIVSKEKETALYLQPMLFKHKGRCYKISYILDSKEEASLFPSCHQPIVHALDIKTDDDGEFCVSVGEEFPQNDLPREAFRINNEVFLIKNGLAHKTDAKIAKIRPL